MVRAGLRLDMQNSSQQRRRNSAPEGWRNIELEARLAADVEAVA
jgi:hypothetical protein